MGRATMTTNAEIAASPYFAGWSTHTRGGRRIPCVWPLAVNGVLIDVIGKTREEISAQVIAEWTKASQ